MINIVGHTRPMLTINEFITSKKALDLENNKLCSSDIPSDSFPCLPPSLTSIYPIIHYDILYTLNWIEFWNITYTNNFIAKELSNDNNFKKWIFDYFGKSITDSYSLKIFSKDRFEEHWKEVISSISNYLKMAMDVEAEFTKYNKVLEKRLPIAIQKGVKMNNIVLVLDRSGSMNQILIEGKRKIDLAKDAILIFSRMLFEEDEIALVTFSSNAKKELDLTKERGKVKEVLDNVVAEGSTAMGDGMRLALDLLKNVDVSERRAAVLLTDGCHNSGKESPEDVLQDAVDLKIPIFTVGIGRGDVRDPSSNECFNPDILKQIADRTGGTFYWIDPDAGIDELELWRIYGRIALTFIDTRTTYMFTGIIMAGDIHSYTFDVGEGTDRLVAMLSYKGSELDLQLISPEGEVFNVSTLNVIAIRSKGRVLITVNEPKPGSWEAKITSIDVPAGGEPYLLTIGTNGLSISPRKLVLDSTQIEQWLPLEISNNGDLVADVHINADGPLSDYIEIKPNKFTLNKGQNITILIKVSQPSNFAESTGRIVVDNNGIKYFIPVSVKMKGLRVNAWIENKTYAGSNVTVRAIIMDEEYNLVTGAEVTASINGNVTILNDDGIPPDVEAGDAMYSGHILIPYLNDTIKINLSARKQTYLPASLILGVKVFQPTPLNILVNAPTEIMRGGPLIIDLTLKDSEGNNISGAGVTAYINNYVYRFNETSPGHYSLRIDSNNLSSDTLITVKAEKTGFYPSSKEIAIKIVERTPLTIGPSITSFNWTTILIPLLVILLLVAMFGYRQSQKAVACINCGIKNNRNARFCRRCGARLR